MLRHLPMRMLFITRKWPPAVGGMETYSAELAEALERRVDLQVEALPGRVDGSPPGAAALIAFGLRNLARRSDPDWNVVMAGDLSIWPLALAASRRASGAQVVLAAHGTDVAYPERTGLLPALYGRYLRFGARLSPQALLVANSGATAARAAQLGFQRQAVNPLGVRFHDAPLAPTEPNEAPFILFAGRLIERKGCAWFAEEVMPRLPGVSLKVAGGDWSAEEKARVRAAGATLLGPVDRPTLAALRRAALACVVPNLPDRGFEGFGLVAPEAAADGGVVVAAEIDGLPDAVVDNETGFLVSPGDAEAWVRRLAEIAAWSPDARAAFTARSTVCARERFSWSSHADRLLSVISEN